MEKSIKVSCEVSNLKSIRHFVESNLNPLLSPTDVNLIVLAVDEVCANLIIHSNNCNEEAIIKLSLKIEKTPDGILFEIFDNGLPFDYQAYQEPSLENVIKKKLKGSIGLILVRRIMDKIEFTREKNQNICRLFKKVTFPELN